MTEQDTCGGTAPGDPTTRSSPPRGGRRWMRVTIASVAVVALPFGAALGFAFGSVWVALGVVVVVGLFARVPLQAWLRRPRSDRIAALLSVATGVLLAVPVAVVLAILSVAVVLAVNVPDAELIGAVWRVPADTGVGLWFVSFAVVIGTYALRPPTPSAVARWSRAHDVSPKLAPAVAGQLRWVRAWRTLPALAAYALGMAPGAAVNLVVATQGADGPAYNTLLAVATNEDMWSGLMPIVIGYMVGALLAEVTRRVPFDPAGGASLDARRPDGYLTRTARRLPLALAAAVVVANAAAVAADRAVTWWPAAGATALVVCVTLAQHYVIRRPQRVFDNDALALDDTLRSSAAHALAGGCAAILLSLALSLAILVIAGEGDAAGPAGFGGTLLLVLGLVGVAGFWALWLHYGSAHRGRRPRRLQITN